MRKCYFHLAPLLFFITMLQTSASDFQEDSLDCQCEFGIQYMTVRYGGPSGADIEVYATKNQQDFVQRFTNVDSATQLFIDKSDFLHGSVKTKTYFTVAGEPSSEVSFHTSCSEDILNKTLGYFTVTAYEDAFGNSCAGELSLQASVSPASCFGDTNGAIYPEISGGFPPYEYEWNDGTASLDRIDLTAGTYQITVRDAMGQTVSDTFTIENPDKLAMQAEISALACGEDRGGVISVFPEGGTPPYSLLWSTGDTTQTINGLSEGSYGVQLTDANDCVLVDTFQIENTGSFEVIISEDACGDGTLNLEVSGGTSPYEYYWSNESTSGQIQVDSAGTYQVVVTDANGCEARDSIQVSTIAYVTATASYETPTCSGDGDGAIYTEVDGNMGPFSFLWNTGDTTQNLENIVSGSYELTITDQRGENCSRSFSFNLQDAPEVNVYSLVQQISCAGEADAQISIDSISGTGPFEIVWENGDTTSVRSDLDDGQYTLTVTDSLGCTFTESFTIQEPDTLHVSVDYDFCMSDELQAYVSGGTSPYSYSWNGQPGGSTFVPDSAGTYYLVVTDSNGCQDSTSITIPEPFEPLNISGRTTSISCDNETGSIDLNVSGGTEPYHYSWSNGDTTSSISGLEAGYYEVVVSDQNECEKSRLFNVQAQNLLYLDVSISDPTCEGETDGTITVSPSGGMVPYSFHWNTGDTTASISDLGAGDYQVTVTDNGGCEMMESFSLVMPESCEDPDNGDTGDEDPNDSTATTDCCDGKVTWLTLEYLGTDTRWISVYQDRGDQLVFSGLVDSGSTFTFYGEDQKETLGPEIIIETDGTVATKIHTSCSELIGPGLISGDFKVVAGESRNGGPLCPVDEDSQQSIQQTTYEVYPNPSESGNINLVDNTLKPADRELEVRIYDLAGQLRSAKTYQAHKKLHNLRSQTSSLPPGQYIVQIGVGGYYEIKKIIIR